MKRMQQRNKQNADTQKRESQKHANNANISKIDNAKTHAKQQKRTHKT